MVHSSESEELVRLRKEVEELKQQLASKGNGACDW